MAAGSLWQIASPTHLPVFVSSHREDGTRKFSSKWQVGRPWLKDDENGTTCEWCMENKQTLISQSVLTSSKFIDGCTSYKAESIAYHENSAAHKLASQYHKAKQNSEKNPRIFGQATRLQLALRSR